MSAKGLLRQEQMEDKAKLVTPEVEVKEADVIINVENEGENGAVELDAVRTNKGRAAAQNTYGFFFDSVIFQI